MSDSWQVWEQESGKMEAEASRDAEPYLKQAWTLGSICHFAGMRAHSCQIILNFLHQQMPAILYKNLICYMKSDDLKMLETNVKHFTKKNLFVCCQLLTSVQTVRWERKERTQPRNDCISLFLVFPHPLFLKFHLTLTIFRKASFLRGKVEMWDLALVSP